ncbi:MAG: clan AA aspartic protease [Deltaproteobacteria bacterium]|nr:clan AA aspartic protease [Deltaproteobacteria bacterium]
MGLVYAEIELVRHDDKVLIKKGLVPYSQPRSMKIKALVDSGALMLAINEEIQGQLKFDLVDKQIATFADGSQKELDIVGPVEIKFENRRTIADAFVLPGNNEILLGAIPMEGLDVLVDPHHQKLIVNPEAPYIPKRSMK